MTICTPIEVRLADYHDPQDARAVVDLLDAYARDPMGGGEPLDEAVIDTLVPALRRYPTAFTLLAFVAGTPAGLVNCFESLSTFRARPLINLHDVAVHPEFRGQGVAVRLLEAVEAEALERGCCKLTLEVLEGNDPAQALYRRHGFDDYALDPAHGRARFWHKTL